MIYCVGECGIDFYVDANGTTARVVPGGRIVNAAAILARRGIAVAMLGDAPTDHLGQLVVDYLQAAGVNTQGIDRPTDAKTPVTIYSADGRSVRYSAPGDEGFDIVWPRVEEGDVLIFGGLHAIDPAIHPQLLNFLSYAAEHAIMIYLPGFYGEETTRITRVMPAIYEGLELANYVITRTADLKAIFDTEDAEKCFRNHLEYYYINLININRIDGHKVSISTYGQKNESVQIEMTSANALEINSQIVATVAKNILNGNPQLLSANS